ncbi:hypothetical protein [Spiroplasma endosymbiont of Polydrusus formosus]|uniref:hypothetical protein n=1 Tax=Spiroplasma endosymbiont of Polydrusus formosus TaxID=3139326 RepID=UPI0035B5213F
MSKVTGVGYLPIYYLIKKLDFSGYFNFIIAIVSEQDRLEINNLCLDATENVFLYNQDMLQRNHQKFDDVKFFKNSAIFKNSKRNLSGWSW